MHQEIRNIAIIAHVDHGKTTLVDKLLLQSGTLEENTGQAVERMLDSNDLEKERGITILSKNTAIQWKGVHINIVDTPGHADFGGEVERILSMVDSVLLLVDALDGPMPQTRFVTQKAFECGLNPIVVVNKIDRAGARPDWVINQVFDLFDSLGASDTQLDFSIIYTSALEGYAVEHLDQPKKDMTPLFELILKAVPAPEVLQEGPLQMQISTLDYSSYVGVIGIGRIKRGRLEKNQMVTIVDQFGALRNGKVGQLYGYLGLERHSIEMAEAGNIVAVAGIEQLAISDTVCSREKPEGLPPLSVDEPTMSMVFQGNHSPFSGREGKYVTSRKILERLSQEVLYNIALKVEPLSDQEKFKVSGRGELHLSILIETMRREGYELAVSRPEVILKQEQGQTLEPYERLAIELEAAHQGSVMETLGNRKGQLQEMQPQENGRIRLEYLIPARGLIGFQTEFLSFTSGTGVMSYVFEKYGPMQGGILGQRKNGVLIANSTGKATAYALFNLEQRGRLLISPQTEVYEGMIIGIHKRSNDLVVNVTKEKQLTNIRAAGSDENIILSPPVKFSLEEALEFINDDELVELTPENIRLRKKRLKEQDRKREFRE